MRLISLVIALVIIGGLVVYNKNALLPGSENSHQTVKQQANQILDKTRSATSNLQQQINQQKKELQQNNQ